ncbi:hypothetical protein [Ureibacillus sp. GCM10028918]|uniref:hypothetical protein n=1 Tax=Ureibacillus sp. GCM10028918 TaxID=3273429 RepID=UPI0036242DC7
MRNLIKSWSKQIYVSNLNKLCSCLALIEEESVKLSNFIPGLQSDQIALRDKVIGYNQGLVASLSSFLTYLK